MPDRLWLRQVVDASGEVIFTTDRDGVFTFVNPQFERLYGYSAEQVVGRATPRIIKGGDRSPEYYADVWTRLANGETVEAAFTNRTKTGRIVEIEAAVNPIYDEGGALNGFLAIQRDVTARNRAEAALRDERDRAQLYLDVADVMLIALDLEGRVTMINRKGCAIVGWDEREIVGRNWLETCVPARIRQAITEKFHHLKSGDLSPVENPVLTKDGSERLIAWRNTVLRDADGTIVGTLSSGEDVTERRATERALGESQAQLQLISDNVLDMVSQIRLDGTFEYVSPSYQAVLGFPPSALIGTSAFEFIHPDDVDRVKGIFAETIARRETGRAQFRSKRADGSYVWVEAVGKLLFDAAGQPSGAILSGRDITERVRSEEARREYDHRLRVAVGTVNMAVFTQDRNLRYTWLHNPQFATSAEQAIGRTDAELLPGDIADLATSLKRRALETGERMRSELTTEEGGRSRSFELIVEPLRSERGDIEGLTGAIIDTTARIELEHQLRQAQKLEAIGSLAGGIAHDFNNLLTAILCYTELILDHLPGGDPLRRDVEEIARAGRSAESLTRQLLIFSRKSIVQPVLLKLNETVTRLDKILRRLVGEHIRFDVRLADNLGVVRADAGQLDQVLMNLVVNARDAMPTGGRLTIRTGTATHEGQPFDFLAVADTGVGMTPEIQAQIFNPFFTTKGPEKGTGLGLSTVHGIVQQAGGHISVDSVPERGSTFTVFLPRAADAPAAGESVKTAVPTGTERILFVEDETAVRTMATRGLSRYGYTVLTAQDAVEAMAKAASEPFDLLITDVVLPGMNGLALAEQIRKTYPGVKVMFTSGFTDDSQLLDGVRSGDTPFLQKPYTMESLARNTRRVLDGMPTA
ncbi:MAG TPA: PAS domain S-box protein [Vicinamibacterales bacterium]